LSEKSDGNEFFVLQNPQRYKFATAVIDNSRDIFFNTFAEFFQNEQRQAKNDNTLWPSLSPCLILVILSLQDVIAGHVHFTRHVMLGRDMESFQPWPDGSVHAELEGRGRRFATPKSLRFIGG
jgi:hypothetical protein